MATTPKGIYYPNNYNEIADIPEDMKKMAESIEEVFENTDSDLSDIKEEQTTQNNRLNSLEVDNTTNKSDILTNKQEINNIKTEQTTQNTNISTNATNIESLQEENDNLKKIVSQLPQVEGQGTSITLENTIEAQFTKFDEEGNSTQESTKGYQLLKYPYANTTKTLNGVTFTDNGDGSIKINGTATEEAAFDLQWSNIVPAGSYTYIIFNLPNNCFANYYGIGNKYGENVGTLTRDSEYNMGSNIHIPAGVTVSNVTVYPMLVSGTYTRETIPNWEKYTGGTASPNPNYEQPIYSAGDNENLLPANNGSETINGVDFTKNSDGTIIANGTATAGINYYINGLDYENIPAGEYTLSDGVGISGGESSNTFFTFLDDAPNSNSTISLPTFTLSQATNLRARIVIRSGVTLDNVVFKPKLEKGNKATPYSPYGMGSINEKIINKNVWNIDKFKNLYGTNTYETYNNVECLKLAGAPQRYNFDGKENTQYTFQFKLIGSTINNEIGAFSLVYSDGTSDYHAGILTPKTYTFTSKANKTLVRIVWNAWNAGNFIYIDKNSMQLEPGSTSTPYVPHKEQDYPIFVQQPMRSIGDVRDLFFKNTVDSPYYDENLTLNGWYERHYIKYLELLISAMNNSENYPGWTNVQQIKNDFPNINTQLITKTSFLCNIFEKTSRIMVINTIGNNSIMYLDKSLLNLTQTQWKENYPNLVLKLGYISPEPLDLPCTETQIQQLENLPSTYKEMTIINSEDETPAYLEVSGIRDINTMFDKVTNAIVSLGGNV